MTQDRYSIIIAVGVFMACLASTTVALRFKARHVRKNSLKADDYTIVFALIFLYGQCVCNIVGAVVGKMGTHYAIENMDDSNLEGLQNKIIRAKVLYSMNIFCSLGPGLIRTSIIFLYQRIFVGKIWTRTAWAIFGLNSTWTVGFFFSNILSCIPIPGYWAMPFPASSCVNFFILYKSIVVSSVILNGLVLILPWYPLWKLNLPFRRKIVVFGIFLLSALAVVFSILRANSIFEALVPNADDSWIRAPAFYWATLETGMGIVCACLPILRPLISRPGSASMFQSVQRKLRETWSSTKLTQITSTMEHSPRESNESGEKISRTIGGQRPGIYDGLQSVTYGRATKVEATYAENTSRVPGAIMVKSIVQSHQH